MKKYILNLAFISLASCTPAYCMQKPIQKLMSKAELALAVEEKAREDDCARPAPAAQHRDPFFVHFNVKKGRLEVSHSSAPAPSPRSLFNSSQTITNLEIDLSTGNKISEQAFMREFNPKTKKVESKITAKDPAIVAALEQQAGVALAAWRARFQKNSPKS